MPRQIPVSRFGSHGALASLLALVLAGFLGGSRSQPAAATANEALRVIRSQVMEGGRTPADIVNPDAVLQNPVYKSWAAWGPGTRVIIRADEVDAEGRASPIERRVRTLLHVSGERALIEDRIVQPGGTLGEPTPQHIPAQQVRHWLVVPRRGERMIIWRRYEGRVAYDVPPIQPPAAAPATAATDSASRKRPPRRQRAPARDPAEALPPEFDCAVLESAFIDESVVEEGRPLPEDAVILWRSYCNVDAPGWEAVIELYRGRLDEQTGEPADMQLMTRWRIERILRPGEPDPTPEQLAAGLRDRG